MNVHRRHLMLSAITPDPRPDSAQTDLSTLPPTQEAAAIPENLAASSSNMTSSATSSSQPNPLQPQAALDPHPAGESSNQAENLPPDPLADLHSPPPLEQESLPW